MPILRFQFRRGTAAEWTEANTVLAEGEPGLEVDTRQLKYGDGMSTWTELPYSSVTEETVAQALSAASESSSSATSAATARTGAETARSGAESARTGAETARDTAAATAAAIPTTNDPIVRDLIANPASLARGVLNATFVGLVQAAKNPDLLIAGAVTVDGSDLVTSAIVAWPDGTPGVLTITGRDSFGGVLGYAITYGSPVTKTFTQPTITRNANGAATNVPQIVVS